MYSNCMTYASVRQNQLHDAVTCILHLAVLHGQLPSYFFHCLQEHTQAGEKAAEKVSAKRAAAAEKAARKAADEQVTLSSTCSRWHPASIHSNCTTDLCQVHDAAALCTVLLHQPASVCQTIFVCCLQKHKEAAKRKATQKAVEKAAKQKPYLSIKTRGEVSRTLQRPDDIPVCICDVCHVCQDEGVKANVAALCITFLVDQLHI